MPSKRESNLIEAVTDVISFMNQNGHKVDTFATDHENCLSALDTFLGSKGIILDPSIPGRHQTVVERNIQHLMRLSHTLKCDIPYVMPDELEGELLSYCIDLINDTPNKRTYPHTPNQLDLKRNPIARSYKWGTIGLFHSYKDS